MTPPCVPEIILHVSFDFINIYLTVKQSSEVSRAGLSSFCHLQIIEVQPEV